MHDLLYWGCLPGVKRGKLPKGMSSPEGHTQPVKGSPLASASRTVVFKKSCNQKGFYERIPESREMGVSLLYSVYLAPVYLYLSK